MTDLGTLGGDKSSASGINELGQVVGWATIGGSGYTPHAFLWENGVMTNLGTLPDYTKSSASDINDAGQVCGTSSRPVPPYSTTYRACLWDNGTVIDLGLLYGYAKSLSAGINAHGQVVGYLGVTLSGGASAAFIWDDGVMTNLNALIPAGSGWVLKSASEINDAGQIVGWGQAPDGQHRGYLLTPISQCPADVNGDSFVDVLDLLAVLAAWGATSGPEDVNGDGVVDVLDLLELLSAWGPC
jgi:probable HAF family extracellular repeat protein